MPAVLVLDLGGVLSSFRGLPLNEVGQILRTTHWGSSTCTRYVLHIKTPWEIMRTYWREELNIEEVPFLQGLMWQAEVSDPAEASQILPRFWRKETSGKDFSELGPFGLAEMRYGGQLYNFSAHSVIGHFLCTESDYHSISIGSIALLVWTSRVMPGFLVFELAVWTDIQGLASSILLFGEKTIYHIHIASLY